MQFHPRMWRGQEIPAGAFGLGDIERSSFRFSRMLAGHLRTIFQYIEPDASHDKVYSQELRSLHILACTEVENQCRAVLKANGVTDARNIHDYSRLVGPMRLTDWEVGLSTRPEYGKFNPFENWKAGASLPWYAAYNATKHDRDANLSASNLGNVIRACAGVYVLNLAQFGLGFREIGAYFSPDEFVTHTGPVWDWHEMYTTPVWNGMRRSTSLPVSWQAVPYPF
jgi:hypothetical protein